MTCIAFTNAQIKSAFQILLDESYSAYFSDTDLNAIFQKAVEQVIMQKMNLFQQGEKISDDLIPLIKTVTLNSASTPAVSSNSFDITNTTLNYRREVSILVTFTGSSTQRVATPLYYAERGDPFSTGTQRNPKYRRSNNLMIIEPSTPTISSIEFSYFKAPKVSEFTQIDFGEAHTSAYSDKVVQEIINEAMKIAAENMREDSMYQMASQERAADKTQ